ncbi:MAG: hypothetical protein ABWZ93_11650, partial [Xanthobacteraceae bacterium]
IPGSSRRACPKAARPPFGALSLQSTSSHRPAPPASTPAPETPGNDLTWRFSLIVEAVGRLRSRSCIIDGEAVACDDRGIASFDLIRHHRNDDRVFLYGFDLIELNGDDLRRDPLQVRKVTLTSVLAKAGAGIRFNSTWKATVRPSSATPASLGLEFIVSKRKDSG